MIEEEYIRKVISMDRDSDGYIQVPNINDISDEQIEFLESIPEIYDEENNKINVKRYDLTNIEDFDAA